MHGRVSDPGAKTFRWALLLGGATMLHAPAARAGGFEIPDNGTEAMGRGAAFVAKASDGTAIYHNPAGLARQRGTHVLADANVYFHSFQFQRAGAYPDDPEDDATPWGGTKYPLAKNAAGPLLKPFVAVTTDFGYFDRLTFAAGIFTPPTVSNRTFPIVTEGRPAPSRYDFVQSRSSLLYPTLAAGFRLTRWLDVGVSGHLVLASFDETRISYIDLGPETCRENAVDDVKLREDFRCDARSNLEASTMSFAGTFGAMARPIPSVAFGLSFRTPTNIAAGGTLRPVAPPIALPEGTSLRSGSATYALQLPWAVRAGGRYIGMDGDFELYDLELDVTYEGWGTSQGLGPILSASDLGSFKNIQSIVQHGYNNTFGVRGGGAYNIDTGEGLVSIRGGAYVDTSATDFKNTRLDYDTLAKVAGTLGVGYKVGPWTLNLSYAAVASIPRTVGLGAGGIRPVNDRENGSTDSPDGDPLPAVNEGAYSGFTHIVALGVGVAFDSFFGPPRKVRYGNAYEPGYAGDEDTTTDEKKPEEKKPEEKKPDEKPPEEKAPSKGALPDSRDDDDEVPPAPEVKKPPPAPPPAPKPEEKPATRRKEWWEEPD